MMDLSYAVALSRGREREPEDELDDDRDPDAGFEWTESEAGDRARERWARAYDELDGAPEGDWDR